MDILQIELINRCNAKCVFCPYPLNLSPKREDMSMGLFKKILLDASLDPPKEIYPFLNGEPFLDSGLMEKLSLINEVLPNTMIKIFTNGHLMTPERVKGLKDIKNISSINVSINSVLDARRMSLMKLPYAQTRDNMINVRDTLNIPLSTSMVYDVCLVNSVDIVAYREEMEFLGIGQNLFPSGNWAGKIRKCYANYDKCCRPFIGMNILANGKAVLCCFDSEGEVVLGDLNKQSLMEIWTSPEYQSIQRVHNQGNRGTLPLCNNCTTI